MLPVLAGVQLLSLWFHLPKLPNHWIFTEFISFGVLLSWAVIRFRGDPDVLGERFAPLARMLTVVLYGLTPVHKLNWGDFLKVTWKIRLVS